MHPQAHAYPGSPALVKSPSFGILAWNSKLKQKEIARGLSANRKVAPCQPWAHVSHALRFLHEPHLRFFSPIALSLTAGVRGTPPSKLLEFPMRSGPAAPLFDNND